MVPLIPEAKKLVTLFLCALLTAGAWIPLATTNAENDAMVTHPAWEVRTHGTRGGGNGTKANPFLIYNVNDLQAMKDNLTAHYALANDINASATKDWNDEAGFVPIGVGPTENPDGPFTGSLDGRGYTIIGLFIDRRGMNYTGLFGSVGSGSTVTNVGLVGVDVTGDTWVGGLVGSNQGSSMVSNSFVTGSVSGVEIVGGLVGENYYSSISNCYATGSVSGNVQIGGLVGWNSRGSVVSNCSAMGSVTGTNFVSGFVGVNGGSVSNCSVTGGVTGTNYVGGLVGGNFIGSVSNCYATGSVSGERWLGGLVGSYVDGGLVENSFYDKDATGQSDTGKGIPKSTLEMKTRSTFTSAGWDFNDVWWLIETITYPLLRWHNVIIAVAGPDQVVDEGTQVIFDGGTSASLDGGGIVNYTWSFHDGMEDIMLYGVRPMHTFTVQGVSIVTLNIMDATGNRDTDTMAVIVDSTPPVANAGPNHTVDEGTQVTLNASASTDNIGIANYTWTFHDDTKDTILYGIAPTYTFTVPGVYFVTLTVTDMAGKRDTDTLHVTVRDITPPRADAGPDRSVKEGAQVTFDGSASSDNVGIINYTWAFTYNGTEVILYGVSSSFQFWTPGEYTVTLTVTDDAGFEDSDIMILRVLAQEEDGATNALLWFLLVVLVVLLLVLFFVVTGKGVKPIMRTGEPVPPPPDHRPPPPEEDPSAPESFRPPTGPTPEHTGEGGQSSPDGGPSPSSTALAEGALSTPDRTASSSVAFPSVEPPDQPGTIVKSDLSLPPGTQSCPECGSRRGGDVP